VALNYVVPKEVFIWVTSVALVGSLWTWGMIMFSHLKFREAVAAGRIKASSFRMPGAPIANWVVLGFLVESNYRRALVLSSGDHMTFLQDRLAAVLLGLALVFIVGSVVRHARETRRAGKGAAG
jgi:L-asparagine transporter-like permease